MSNDYDILNDRRSMTGGRRLADGMSCGEQHGQVVARIEGLEAKQRHTCVRMEHDSADIYSILRKKVPWSAFISFFVVLVTVLSSVLVTYFGHTERAFEKLSNRMDINSDKATICVTDVGEKIDSLSHRVVAIETILISVQKELEKNP